MGVVFCFVWCGGVLWYKVTIKKWNMEVSGVCFGFGCFSVFLLGGFVVWCLVWMVCCLVQMVVCVDPEEMLFDPEGFCCLYCCVLGYSVSD